MKLRKLMTVLLMAVFSMMYSQESKKTNQGDYIKIDLSKSHPLNQTIDHLYYLNLNSQSVELPGKVIQFLESITDENEPHIHEKLTFQRSEILKVLYNERISPEDKRFLCAHYLEADSLGVNPIKDILRKYLKKGKLY